MKNPTLDINCIRKKTYTIYKIKITRESQIKELCKFLKDNKDKNIEMVLNNKSVKFNTIAGKKGFALGYECGSGWTSKYTKLLFSKFKSDINILKSKLFELDNKIIIEKDKYNNMVLNLNTIKTVSKIKQIASEDYIMELNEDRSILKDRLDKIEPIIKLVLKNKLEKAYVAVKKLK